MEPQSKLTITISTMYYNEYYKTVMTLLTRGGDGEEGGRVVAGVGSKSKTVGGSDSENSLPWGDA